MTELADVGAGRCLMQVRTLPAMSSPYKNTLRQLDSGSIWDAGCIASSVFLYGIISKYTAAEARPLCGA